MTKHEADDSHLPEWVDPALLDAEERVASDVPCVHCDYNLRTLPASSLCPECAQPVQESLRRLDLRWASPRWVGGLALGVRCLWLAHLLLVPAVGAAVCARVLPQAVILAALVGIVAGAVAASGTTLVTGLDSGTRSRPQRVALRYAARFGPPAAIVAAAMTFVVIEGLRPTRISPRLSIPFVGTVFFGLVVSWPALFRYLAGLLRRAPDDGLARAADALALGLLLLGLFTFLHALLPGITGPQVLHPLRDLRICVVGLTGVGYVSCGLLGAIVLHRTWKVFSNAAAAARNSVASS